MAIMSKREFNQNPEKALELASQGPVFIQVDDEPTHVLLTVQDYNRLVSPRKSLPELLGMADDVDFEPEQWPNLVP